MKILKKTSLILLIVFMLISTSVLAATISSEKAKLEIVENNICTIKITDSVTFEKKIVDYDLSKKELTIGLTISNDAEIIKNPPFEVVLVIDNSLSMTENKVTSEATRLDVVTNSAKTLANKLLENENTSLAIVSFSTGKTEGTLSDATLRTALTKDSSKVLTAIDNIASKDGQGPRTNIDAGLQMAYQCFSKEDNNKYVILLTDGIPNTAVGGPTFTYSGEVATKTKATLNTLNEKNINVLSAMIGLDGAVIEPMTEMSYKSLAEEIFGTIDNPYVGKYYYIPDEENEIEELICETIFSNIVDTTANTLTNIDIYDYFPDEIINNFNFEYVASPNLGKVSPKIDLENKCIVWHIDELKPQTKGSLSYKLTLKPNIDSEIVNVVLNTNKKVDITANEIKTDDGSNVVSSSVTPKVKVTLPEDPTITDKVIPQTGSTNTFLIIVSLVTLSTIIIGFRFYILRKNMR